MLHVLYLFKYCIFRSRNNYLKIDWLVLQNKEDIADFVIFSAGNKLDERISSKLVPYNLRSQTIKTDFIKVKYISNNTTNTL